MKVKLKSPMYCQLEITRNCNNFCNYCYNHWRKADSAENFKEDFDTAHFFKIIEEIAKNEVFQLTLTGGEPLLRKKSLPKIIEYASQRGIEVSLNTNLTLIDAIVTSELKNAGLKNILGSLVSHDKDLYNLISGTRNYGRVLQGIEAVITIEGFE